MALQQNPNFAREIWWQNDLRNAKDAKMQYLGHGKSSEIGWGVTGYMLGSQAGSWKSRPKHLVF